MALPKRRHSRARGRKRRTNWKLSAPNIVECSQCHQPKLPHHICPYCGYYKGELVATPKE
ncbi:MAG TPA: 50S ribosomal protein L32 [candidate division Zixibacteria bacterium]|nr:50S ribosomal protein L32 [candidate division Zixibacteria bacterium]